MKATLPFSTRLGILLAGSALLAVLALAIARNSDSVLHASAESGKAAKSSEPPVRFTDDGRLLQPEGYRQWMYVGTPLTPNDMNGGQAAFPEFHSVYIDPDAYRHFEKTAQFPDGTVVVKELISVGSKRASSGRGYFMGEFSGLEVAVKDRVRFKGEPGNWAYFSFGHEYPLAARATAQPVANCNACHGAGADDDYVFTQYYPVLRATKGSANAE